MPLLFILFIVAPIVEIWVLIEVGSRIGVFNTIGLVILTAIIGSVMLRNQGLSMLARARQQMAANQLPAAEVFEGLFLVVGGALLLTPGFVTDTIGFLCLLPVTRTAMAQFLLARFTVRGFSQSTSSTSGYTSRHAHTRSTSPNTLEGEYRRED